MKKNIILLIVAVLFALNLSAALYRDLPMKVTQPDGSVIECLSTGDEYFNYLHDEDDFTIIQNPQDGFYYYGRSVNGEIVPSQYKVGSVNPVAIDLNRKALISKENYLNRKDTRDNVVRDGSRAPHFGTLVNLVVYIRFSDQSEFTNNRAFFDQKFNDDEPGANSVYNYYQEVSYQNLDIETYHYPECEMDINLSYQDPNPRGYYSPYDYNTNPIGYSNSSESTYREHTLLANAIAYIESMVPDTLNIDGDNDGRLDSICFIIRGGNDAWADLLWAHRWALYSQNVYLHGSRVYDYTFQPESQNSISTLCHELFHLLGAPDLYHYNSDGFSPAGPWDIMDGSYTHMSAYMKWRYGFWIEEIPEITESGTYYLNPLTEPDNNCYKITSSHCSSEYIVLEYRKRVPGSVEMNLPGSGLIISRVNTTLDGQGNAGGPPDEFYIYRPGGTPNSNGDLSTAYFSSDVWRTEFNDTTDPCDFFSDGTLGGIMIGSIGEAGDSISFILNPQNSFLMGNISSDNEEVDIMDAVITLNGQEVEILEGGDFFISYIEGTHELEIILDGHATYEEQVVLLPGEITTVNVQLQYLDPPYDLTYYYDDEAQEITLSWEFDNFEDPEFSHFNVYMSVNGVYYNFIGECSESTFCRPLMPVISMYYSIDAEYTNGNSAQSNFVLVEFTPSDDDDIPPVETKLYANYPNPFNPSTVIQFDLGQESPVNLSVYNTRGQLVKTLLTGSKQTGSYSLIWDGTNDLNEPQSSGVYFYKLHYSKKQINKKMLMMK
jgi:M6 family metalloprotease-like protein